MRALVPQIQGIDPDKGVSLRDAIVLYGDLPNPRWHWTFRMSLELLKGSGKEPNIDRLIKHIEEECAGRDVVIQKLVTGELIARGFERGASAGDPRVLIHPDRWRGAALECDFETSAATWPGLTLDGILVFSAVASSRMSPSVAAEKSRPGPRADAGARMLAARREITGTFATKKEEHSAVLEHLGIKDPPRGYSYDNFIKQAAPDLDR
jgi:hypothetical protein